MNPPDAPLTPPLPSVPKNPQVPCVFPAARRPCGQLRTVLRPLQAAEDSGAFPSLNEGALEGGAGIVPSHRPLLRSSAPCSLPCPQPFPGFLPPSLASLPHPHPVPPEALGRPHRTANRAVTTAQGSRLEPAGRNAVCPNVTVTQKPGRDQGRKGPPLQPVPRLPPSQCGRLDEDSEARSAVQSLKYCLPSYPQPLGCFEL